ESSMPIFPDTLSGLQNGTLQELNLAPYVLSREDIQTVTSLLPVNKSLKSIFLGSCQYDRELLEAFADALKHNTSLVDLSMCANNDIGDNGARALGAMLEANRNLVSLNLGKANI